MLFLVFPDKPDCVDDFKPENFKFTDCDDFNLTLKCSQDGKCYNKTTFDGSVAICSNVTGL